MYYRDWPCEGSLWHPAPDTAWAAYWVTIYSEAAERGEDETPEGHHA